MLNNKYIVIGDIHGRGSWVATEKYIKEGYKIIFLGDYMDTQDDIDILSIHMNFLEIIRFKEDYPNDIILLVGNHDYSYLNPTGQCSGYRHQTQNFVNKNEELFLNNLKVLHRDGEFLFSHAGVSPVYLDENNLTLEDLEKMKCDDDNLRFVWKGFRTNSYGDNYYQTPIWIRPESLIHSTKEFPYKQVVGHTPCQSDSVYHYENKIFLNDRLRFNQAMKVENNEVELIYL